MTDSHSLHHSDTPAISARLIDPMARMVREVALLTVTDGGVLTSQLQHLLETDEPTIWRSLNGLRVEYASDAYINNENAFTIVGSEYLTRAETGYRARTIIGPALVYGISPDGAALNSPVSADWLSERVVWSKIG